MLCRFGLTPPPRGITPQPNSEPAPEVVLGFSTQPTVNLSDCGHLPNDHACAAKGEVIDAIQDQSSEEHRVESLQIEISAVNEKFSLTVGTS